MSRAFVQRNNELSSNGSRLSERRSYSESASKIYGALDLGTNNCRLLMARPSKDGFRVVDAFSRIVRLGEGLGVTQVLGEAAILRTIEALKICRSKMDHRGVSRARLIATEACRAARNSAEFISRVAESVVLFDIGGGSTEIVWLDQESQAKKTVRHRMREWSSLPVGVVSLAERHGGRNVTPEIYRLMVSEVVMLLQPFVDALGDASRPLNFHLLGTSGTVTTLAGVHLGLPRYDRRAVDGIWMKSDEISVIVDRLLHMTYQEREASACIGTERADLVLSGCAILDAIRQVFPSDRVRVADRGLREGILMQMMMDDGVWPQSLAGRA